MGSVAAAYAYLASRGIPAQAVLPSIYPGFLAFLDPADNPVLIHRDSPRETLEAISAADLMICLDFNNLGRTEYLEEAIISSNAVKVLIDHHIQPDADKFDIVFSQIEVSSTCELLFKVLMQLSDVDGNVDRLPMQCAEALYSGMLTDTNNFANSTWPSTFNMAADLTARGVDTARIRGNIFSSYTEKRMRLMGHMLKDKMTMVPEMDAAFMLLSNQEKQQHDFKPGDSEGFVNLPLSIGGVTLSALFTEDSSGEYIRVSLRSKGQRDVNTFSRLFFNGGGHLNASGGRLYMPLGEVPGYFIKSLKEYGK